MDLEGAIDFLLKQAAKTDAAVQMLAERQATTQATLGTLIEHLTDSERRRDEEIAEIRSTLKLLIQNQTSLTKNQMTLTENAVKFMDRFKSVDERLDFFGHELQALRHAIEAWLRRSGNGASPETNS